MRTRKHVPGDFRYEELYKEVKNATSGHPFHEPLDLIGVLADQRPSTAVLLSNFVSAELGLISRVRIHELHKKTSLTFRINANVFESLLSRYPYLSVKGRRSRPGRLRATPGWPKELVFGIGSSS